MTDSPPHTADHIKFPVGANVLSLQARRRDLRRSVMAGNSEGLHVESHRDTRRLKLLLDLALEAISNREVRGLVNAIMMRIKSALDSDGVCILLKRQKEGELDLYALDFRSEGQRLQGENSDAPRGDDCEPCTEDGKAVGRYSRSGLCKFSEPTSAERAIQYRMHAASIRPQRGYGHARFGSGCA